MSAPPSARLASTNEKQGKTRSSQPYWKSVKKTAVYTSTVKLPVSFIVKLTDVAKTTRYIWNEFYYNLRAVWDKITGCALDDISIKVTASRDIY